VQRYLRQKTEGKKTGMGISQRQVVYRIVLSLFTTRMAGWLHPDVTDVHTIARLAQSESTSRIGEEMSKK
jgi:hypothetical protein